MSASHPDPPDAEPAGPGRPGDVQVPREAGQTPPRLGEDHFAVPPPDTGQVQAVGTAVAPFDHDSPPGPEPVLDVREQVEQAVAAAVEPLGDAIGSLRASVAFLRARADEGAGPGLDELVADVTEATGVLLRRELAQAIVALARELSEFVRTEVRDASSRVEGELTRLASRASTSDDLVGRMQQALREVLDGRVADDAARERDGRERLVREIANLLDQNDPHERALADLARDTAALAVAGAAERFDTDAVVAELRASTTELRSEQALLRKHLDGLAASVAQLAERDAAPQDPAPQDQWGRLDAVLEALAGRDRELRRLRAGLAEFEAQLNRAIQDVGRRIDGLSGSGPPPG